MAGSAGKTPDKTALHEGNTCLVSTTGRHFMVRILDISGDAIKTTFPGVDYLVAGMLVDLEFHNEEGFLHCRTQVLREPHQRGDNLTLAKPDRLRLNKHRASYRVPTDLTGQLRETGHPRRYDAALIDLGSGGTLVQTKAPLERGTEIEIELSLPMEPLLTVTGEVVHAAGEGEMGTGHGEGLFGVRFKEVKQDTAQALAAYIHHRLSELHDEQG